VGQRIKPKGIQIGRGKDYRSINSIIRKRKRKEVIYEDRIIRGLVKKKIRKEGYYTSEIYIKRREVKELEINITIYPGYGKRKIIEIYKNIRM